MSKIQDILSSEDLFKTRERNFELIEQFTNFVKLKHKMFDPDFLDDRYQFLSPDQKNIQKVIDFNNFDGILSATKKEEILGFIKEEIGAWTGTSTLSKKKA